MALRRVYCRRICLGALGFGLIVWYGLLHVLVNPLTEGVSLPTQVVGFIPGQRPDAPIPWRHAPELPRVITLEEHNAMLRLLNDVTGLLRAHNITHTIAFGSLIGSYMFHDLIPWDDDMDVLILWDDIPKLKRMLANTELRQTYGIHAWKGRWIGNHEYDVDTLRAFPPNSPDALYYQLAVNDNTHKYHTLYHWFKIFSLDAQPAGDQEWNWPFIDMTFYKENATHVFYFEDKPEIFAIPKKSFYPLIKRPMGKFLFNSPSEPGYFLKTRYKNFRCSNQDYTHRREKKLWPWQFGDVNCSHIYPFYPMVVPLAAENGITTEQLSFVPNGETIQTVEIAGQHESFRSQRPYDF